MKGERSGSCGRTDLLRAASIRDRGEDGEELRGRRQLRLPGERRSDPSLWESHREPRYLSPELGRSCAGKCQSRPIPAQLSPSRLFNPLELGPRRPRGGERTGCCAPSLSVPPSHPPAGLQGAKGSGSGGAERPARCSGAQPEPEPPLLAPGIAPPAFKPHGTRGAGGTRAAPLANRRSVPGLRGRSYLPAALGPSPS